MAHELEDHTVLVTGASSGIGRAIAIAAARAGGDVGLTYSVNEDGAQETARAIEAAGRRALVFRLDLAERGLVDRLIDNVRQTLGRVDAWVNNAGADILTGPGAKLPAEERLDRLLAVDLRGTILASWAAAKMLAGQDRGGVIINMSWDHAITGMEGRNPQMFAAAKGGVMAFSKSLARSVGPKVRVNILAPGWIETAFAKEHMDPERYKKVADSTPLKRWGTPDDVANAAVFLMSPAAAFLTGQTIFVNGGVVMG